MTFKRARKRVGLLPLAVFGALVLASTASAHAVMSPPVVLANKEQIFTLAVLNEKEDATIARIELTPPSGFTVVSFAGSPGWKRGVQGTGSGDELVVRKVTWSGGSTPAEESAVFEFLGSADAAKISVFKVRQTYSDGTVEDWSGPASSDTPAATVEVRSTLGGTGGGSDTLAIVALGVGAIALIVGAIALLTGSGRRPLA